MRYVISCGHGNSIGASPSFGVWAADREAEGWHGVAVGDHITSGGFWDHPFVSLGAMATATSGVRLMTAMANNLLRSPVEVAQAALTLQRASGGRFELGLGAGWQREEIEGVGLDYPPPSIRARRYLEAVRIVRELLTAGRVTATGEHYDVDVDFGATAVEPPPIVGAVAGRWTSRHVSPLVDRVELLPLPETSASGAMRTSEIAGLDRDEIRRTIDVVKEHGDGVPVSLLLFVAVGRDAELAPVRSHFSGSFAQGLCGPPDHVAATLSGCADLGVDGLTLIPLIADKEAALAEHLLH